MEANIEGIQQMAGYAGLKGVPKTVTVDKNWATNIKEEMEVGLMWFQINDSTVTIPKSQVSNFNKNSQNSLKEQEAKAATMKHEDIDLNTGN